MRGPRLATVLILLNLALLGTVVLALSASGVRVLRRLADEQAAARVTVAGTAAQRALEAAAEDLRATTRLLSERPTLRRLSGEGSFAELSSFLGTFASTSGLSGCAVAQGDRVLASTGQPLDWQRLASTERGTVVRHRDGSLSLAASSQVVGVPGLRVMGAIALDARFTAALGRRVGLPVRLVAGDGTETQGPLHSGGAWRVVSTVAGLEGQPLLVETTLPADAVGVSLRHWVRTFVWVAVALAAVAAVLSFALGRFLGRPIEALTRSAVRIGSGDLETAVPAAGAGELGTLADRMDDMRQRLRHLTAELRRRQAEAEAILSGMVEGVYAVDAERRIQYLNPRAAALLGTTVEEAAGRFCGDVLRPAERDGVRPCEDDCPILHARFLGSARAVEHLQPGGDGPRRTVVITSAAPVEGQQIQLLRDETDVEATRRVRDRILATISHEFRTPLSAQLASIELLRDQLQGLPAVEARQLVGSLERGALRLTRLIDNLLESVRIEAGSDSLRRQQVALDEVVEEAAESTRPLLAQRGQRLEIDLPHPLPPVAGDGPRLVQVFVNLLANAQKFAPEGSVVRIGGTAGEREVTVWVEDEGPGFPTGAEDGTFSPFTRAPLGSDEPDAAGMGLGLFIARSIVARHGGALRPVRADDRTRMCVTLPVHAQAPGAVATA